MTDHRPIAPNEDPVCGMTVDVDEARKKGLVQAYDGHEYAFCGRGCFLEFRDDPEAFLKPGYAPSM